MSSVVDGFRNQSWLILGMDGLNTTYEKIVPVSEATESDIVEMIETMAKAHLTSSEIDETPSLYRAVKDESGGKRLIITAGQDPHYVASLWRSDELHNRKTEL